MAPPHLPSRTRPTRPHGCTDLRDKRYEVPFKLKQRVLTIPLCPAFDQHRQNNKAVLRGLRAKVYSAEPHIKGQICPRKPYWAWNEAEWQSHGIFVQWNLCQGASRPQRAVGQEGSPGASSRQYPSVLSACRWSLVQQNCHFATLEVVMSRCVLRR
jgi:hypothetical protein